MGPRPTPGTGLPAVGRADWPGPVRWTAAILLWALLLVLYTYEASWRPPWPASTPEEDAFISFRFAENIAEGQGPVFNRGGEPFEGYTNFLWVMWLAALHEQWPDTVVHALWSGWALGFLCLIAAYLLARRVCAAWAWCVPPLVAVSAYHGDNALTGMETMAYNLFVLLAAALFADVLEAAPGRRRVWAAGETSCLLLLAALTRFEGVYLFGLFSLFWAWQRRRGQESLVRDWSWYLPFVTGYAAYTTWRLAVFGALLPGTYWAKLVVTGTGWDKVALGLQHVAAFGLRYPALVVMLIAFVLSHPWRGGRPYDVFLLSALVAQLALVAYVGGDWRYLASYWRLLSTVAPLFLVLGLVFVEDSLARRRRWPAFALLGCCLLLSAVDLRAALGLGSPGSPELQPQPPLQATMSELLRLPHELAPRLRGLVNYQDSDPERAIARWLHDRVGADGRVAGQHAGRVPYYSRLQFSDVIGFTDSGLRKLRWDRPAHSQETGRWPEAWDYLLASRPDGVLVADKGDDREVYEALVAAIDRHGYCLGNRIGVRGRRLGFLLFVPDGGGCPEDSCPDSVEVGGRTFRLCREGTVWVGEDG